MQEYQLASLQSVEPIFNFSLVRANSIDQKLADHRLMAKLESTPIRSELVKIIKAELSDIGITHFSIRQIFKQGDIEEPVMTFPRALNNKIDKLALADHDLAVDYALAGNSRPLCLSDINGYLDSATFVTRDLEKNRQLRDLYSRFGFEDVLFLPVLMKGQSVILLLSMAALDKSVDEFQQIMRKNGDLIMGLVNVVAKVGLLESSELVAAQNNDKQKELENNAFALLTIMAARDISLKGAAALMGISSGIASKYIAAAKSMLNTSSQSHAVYRAIAQGRIQCQLDG